MTLSIPISPLEGKAGLVSRNVSGTREDEREHALAAEQIAEFRTALVLENRSMTSALSFERSLWR
jgi:hypothetical protein